MTVSMHIYTVTFLNDDRDHSVQVEAFSFASAAEIAVERDERRSAEFPVASSFGTSRVDVRTADGDFRRFEVSGETVAVYSAKEIDDASE